ncbi:MAG: hypothetical protein ACTSQJ_14200 [Promethearchaeota archaeon]
MTEKFNWDEIKEQLSNSIKLEKNAEDLSLKIIILESNLEENKVVGGMFKGEDEMKRSLGQFLGKKEPIDCNININQEEKYIILKFKNKKDFKKVYNLFQEMFFGDFFKEIIEAMMGAFGGMFGNNEF